jgi:hypothetical protein
MCSESTRSFVVPGPLRLTGRYFGDAGIVTVTGPLDTHEVAWAAGFFDGEGCSYFTRNQRGVVQPCTEVNQVHPAVLHRFQRALDGVGSMRVRPDHPKHRPNPMWSFYTRSWRPTLTVLTLLWPYLGIVKREQASRVFAQYQTEIDHNPLIGRPNMQHLWTATACPLGHTDFSVRMHGGYPLRRCRVCRRDGTSLSYRTE